MTEESPVKPVEPIALDDESLDTVSGGKPAGTGGNKTAADDWLSPV